MKIKLPTWLSVVLVALGAIGSLSLISRAIYMAALPKVYTFALLTLSQDVIVVLCFALFHFHAGRTWQDIGLQKAKDKKYYLKGILIGFLSWGIVLGYGILYNLFAGSELPSQNVEAFFPKNVELTGLLMLALTTCVLAPFFEEIIFRGFIFHLFLNKGWGAQGAMLSTSIIFGLIHHDLARLLPLVIGGYLFNYLAYKSKSLIPGMIAHGIWNSFSVIIYFTMLF